MIDITTTFVGDVALNYHPTKFSSVVKGSVDIWTKLDLDGELVVERNYRKTLFALRIHTCMKRFNALLNHYEYNITP